MSIKDIKPYKGKRRSLLNYLLNPDNCTKTVAETCREISLSTKTYYKYTNEKDFNQALVDEAINAYARFMPQTATSVIKAAMSGDMRAAKLLHEALSVTGKQAQQTVNVGVQGQDTQVNTAYASDNEALIAIDQDITTLQAYRQAIMDRQTEAGNSRLKGDGIHRQGESEGTEGA